MTDWASFKHGAVTYPLPADGSGVGGVGASLLRDVDPFTFYLLEFFASVINTHVGTRLLQEAVGCDATWLAEPVANQLPLNPEPFLTEEHIRFPLLAATRKGTTFEYMGQRKLSVDRFEVSYVLQPLEAAQAERLVPVLKAIVAILDSRTELGFDPAYTPTTPTGTAGEKVWAAARAGLSRVEMTSVEYGGYSPSPDVFFPAVVMTFTAKERTEAVTTELQAFNGGDNTVDMSTPEPDGTIADFIQTASYPAPVAVGPCSPATGTKAGGTPVSIPCTGLRVGRVYRAIFNGADASNVLAVSATELSCVTPQVAAYPTLASDLYLIDQDGQASNVLSGAFVFTTP